MANGSNPNSPNLGGRRSVQIPIPASRKRHTAGVAALNKNSKGLDGLGDATVKSKQVPLNNSKTSTATESDMDSSLGILSPSDMKSDLSSLSTSVVSNCGWTNNSVMTRSRTFTRDQDNLQEAEASQLENDCSLEDLDKTYTVVEKEFSSPIKSKEIKKFKLEIEEDSDKEVIPEVVKQNKNKPTSLLVARTERLLKSKPKPLPRSNLVPNTNKKRSEVLLDEKALENLGEDLKSRTNELLHSKTRRKKKIVKAKDNPNDTFDASNAAFSNMFKPGLGTEITASVLSSDAGISSMPSSMISNHSTSQEIESGPPKSKYIIVSTPPGTAESAGDLGDKQVGGGYSSLPAGFSEVSPAEVARSRSKEKGMATKRAELLADVPIMPNTNVGSKLKAMLEAEKQPRREKTKRTPGKWDAIMNKIAENRKSEAANAVAKKEVKSKVFADFVPPKLIRPPSKNDVTRRSTSSVRRSASNSSRRSNSTVSSNGQMLSDLPSSTTASSNLRLSSSSSKAGSVVVSRSTSTASMASQMTTGCSASNSSFGGKFKSIEAATSGGSDLGGLANLTVDNSDNVSECTLKNVTRKSAKNGGKTAEILFHNLK